MGFGKGRHRPSRSPTPRGNPTSAGPHPRALPPSGTPASLPAEPALLQQLEARDSENGTRSWTSRLGRGARPKPGPGRVPLAGAPGHAGCRGTRGARRPEPRGRPLRSRGASFGRTCIPSRDKPQRGRTPAFRAPTHQGLPTSRTALGRPRGAGNEPGAPARCSARADAGAFLPAGPSYTRRAGPPAEQRGPSPGRAGRGGRGAGPAGPHAPGALLARPASSARRGGYPPSGHPKLCGLLHFRRGCVDSCYTGPFPAHSPGPSTRSGRDFGSPALRSPRAPSLTELTGRALPEVGGQPDGASTKSKARVWGQRSSTC